MYSEGYEDYSRLPVLPWNAAGGSAKIALDTEWMDGTTCTSFESHSSCSFSIWKTGRAEMYTVRSLIQGSIIITDNAFYSFDY